MDVSRIISILKRELLQRNGPELLAFQNHLYGCFIVMEDITQGILEIIDNDYIVGNSLYLNTKTQFGQIGIRYYGFTMDGKAVLEGDIITGDYYEAWMDIFRKTAILHDMEVVDRVENEVVQLMSEFRADENYFMNALDHEGNLSPDWIEKSIYVFHPHMEKFNEKMKNDQLESDKKENSNEKEKKNEKEEKEEKELNKGTELEKESDKIERKKKRLVRGLSVTRRRMRQTTHTRLSTTRRHSIISKK